jgi:hypothetical protein
MPTDKKWYLCSMKTVTTQLVWTWIVLCLPARDRPDKDQTQRATLASATVQEEEDEKGGLGKPTTKETKKMQ